MTEQSIISYGKFHDYSWIRCEGRGNFLTSTQLKQCSDFLLQQGEKTIVVDLAVCVGMDSTFMGILAGLSLRLAKQVPAGVLQIAQPGDKNRSSLEDLGLDALMEIEPVESAWRSDVDGVRSKLEVWVGVPAGANAGIPESLARGMQVLEAHKILSSTSAENAKKFDTVVTLLEQEISQKLPPPPASPAS